MRKVLFILVLALFSSLVQVLFAQDTSPVPTSFPIKDGGGDPAYRDLTLFPVNPVLRGTKVSLQAYPVEYGDAVDSVYYPVSSRTSLEGETKYDIEVVAISYGTAASAPVGTYDSTATVTIRKRSYRTDSTANVVVWLNRANRNVVDALGWTFNNTVSVGDKFRVVLTYDYLMAADRNGNLKVSPQQLLDSLTIYTSGSLNKRADTLSTNPFSARYTHNLLTGKFKGVHASDSVRVGIGVVLMDSSFSAYGVPLGATYTRVSVLADSLFLPTSADSLFYYPITLPAFAYSAKLLIWNKSILDSITVGPLRILQRD